MHSYMQSHKRFTHQRLHTSLSWRQYCPKNSHEAGTTAKRPIWSFTQVRRTSLTNAQGLLSGAQEYFHEHAGKELRAHRSRGADMETELCPLNVHCVRGVWSKLVGENTLGFLHSASQLKCIYGRTHLLKWDCRLAETITDNFIYVPHS